MKFLRFQEVDLQALVNAERSANSCNNRRLHRRWATIVSALPTTTLQVALGTPKVAKRITMSTKPTQPLSLFTTVSVTESHRVGLCIC